MDNKKYRTEIAEWKRTQEICLRYVWRIPNNGGWLELIDNEKTVRLEIDWIPSLFCVKYHKFTEYQISPCSKVNKYFAMPKLKDVGITVANTLCSLQCYFISTDSTKNRKGFLLAQTELSMGCINTHTQHSEDEDHCIWSHYFMGNRWGNSENSVRLYFLGLQNHCRWWLQPWN